MLIPIVIFMCVEMETVGHPEFKGCQSIQLLMSAVFFLFRIRAPA